MVAITKQQIKAIAGDPKASEELEAIWDAEPVNWMEQHCKIITKSADKVWFKLNSVQRIVAKVKRDLRAEKKQVWIIILKFRQGGITTESLGDMYCDANQKKNRRNVLLAHTDVVTTEIFTKARMFQNENPEPIEEEYNNRREITFAAPHYSKLQVMTAGDPDVGRGGTIQYAHCSEVSIWKKASSSLLALLNCIPAPHVAWDVTVIYESTANGVGGEFYETWCDAHPYEKSPHITLCKGHRDSNFIAIFLPWHIFEENKMKVPAGFQRDSEEELLVTTYDLDDEQLQWRRWMIRNKCGRSVDKFKQENPACDLEAFLATGRPVFESTLISLMGKGVREPMRPGRFIDGNEGTNKQPNPVFVEETDGPVEIFAEPAVGEIYVIGADTAEGLDPDDTNKQEDTDANSAHCGGVKGKQVVAKISSRFEADLFGEQLALMSWYYQDALVGVEINNTSGGSTRTTLKNWAQKRYLNLYYREKWDEDNQKMTKKLGWSTDNITRGGLVTLGQQVVRTREYYIPSRQTIAQMSRWIFDKTGKATHPSGENDDDVMSYLIMLEMMISASGVGATGDEVPDHSDSVDDSSEFKSDMLEGGVEQEEEYADEYEEEYV